MEPNIQETKKPFSLSNFLFGSSLSNADLVHQTINNIVGLAVFSSDALSSVAYATEAMLFILIGAGVAALHFTLPISFCIAGLLLILTISYRQTVFAYTNGGGAYIVAHDNFGEKAAQVAGAALLMDYILTVSVSISSGVAQIASAFPFLLGWKVELVVAMIVLMMLINLRGVKESGTTFAIPTYFFLIMMIGMIGIGFYKLFTGNLSPVTGVNSVNVGVTGALTLFLLLHAFASGCSALTGVEAISNGISAFKEPKSKNAAKTMAWMSGLLGFMFISISFLAVKIHALPSLNETVISQIARAIYGTGTVYVLLLASTSVVLVMAANTAFADFPRLSALHAEDGFLPRQLTSRGKRLVLSNGIILLSFIASVLVIVFRAEVNALIPLYAIGVFLSFTLSQSGMVVRWLKISRLKLGEVVKSRGMDLVYDPAWRRKIAVNGFGALVTFTVVLIQAITKFTEGAWIVIVLIPTFVWLFSRIHNHYKSVAEQLSLDNPDNPYSPSHKYETVVILVGGMHQGTLKAVEAAHVLNPRNIMAVHVALKEEKVEYLKQKWEQYVPDIPLEIIPSPHRELIKPLTEYLKGIEKKWTDDVVIVIMSQFIPTRFWHNILHNQTATHIHWALQHDEDLEILDVPYVLKDKFEKKKLP